MSGEETSADRNVEIWKIKKLIKSLEMARGWVLSMIYMSFNVPPNDCFAYVCGVYTMHGTKTTTLGWKWAYWTWVWVGTWGSGEYNHLSLLSPCESPLHCFQSWQDPPPHSISLFCIRATRFCRVFISSN